MGVQNKGAGTTPSQLLQQQRAAFALQIVGTVTGSAGIGKCFKAYVNGLPAMIQSNGIGQALAFAKMKANGKGDEACAWSTIYGALGQWLLDPERGIWSAETELMQAIVKGDQFQYRLAQAEAQALLVWLKQFARSEIVGV